MQCKPSWETVVSATGFALILGVRTFQGVGRNGPTREQVVRRITKDLRTRRHVLGRFAV